MVLYQLGHFYILNAQTNYKKYWLKKLNMVKKNYAMWIHRENLPLVMTAHLKLYIALKNRT